MPPLGAIESSFWGRKASGEEGKGKARQGRKEGEGKEKAGQGIKEGKGKREGKEMRIGKEGEGQVSWKKGWGWTSYWQLYTPLLFRQLRLTKTTSKATTEEPVHTWP